MASKKQAEIDLKETKKKNTTTNSSKTKTTNKKTDAKKNSTTKNTTNKTTTTKKSTVKSSTSKTTTKKTNSKPAVSKTTTSKKQTVKKDVVKDVKSGNKKNIETELDKTIMFEKVDNILNLDNNINKQEKEVIEEINSVEITKLEEAKFTRKKKNKSLVGIGVFIVILGIIALIISLVANRIIDREFLSDSSITLMMVASIIIEGFGAFIIITES